jgi:uncharacterized phage protein gp47/JayE
MPFARPTLTEIINRIKSDFNTYVADSISFLRRSVYNIFAKTYGAALHLLYDYLEYAKDQLFILTADEAHLEKHGAEYGIFKNNGTRATGSTVMSGTVGETIPAQTEIQSDSDNIYRTDSLATIGAGGTVSVAFTAAEVGNDYNEDAGTTLTFVSPLINVNVDTTVDSNGITGGLNEDTVEEFRTKILNRKRKPPHGGTEDDYETWALEYAGVTRAWSIPQYQGAGTIGLAFVMDDETDIFPDETTRDAVKAYIVAHSDPGTGKTVGVPVTAQPGFFVIENAALTMNMTIQISPNTSAVQSAVLAKLADMILQKGGAEETVTISHIYEAVSTSLGEEKCKIIVPTDDVTATAAQVHVLGDVTFQDYV